MLGRLKEGKLSGTGFGTGMVNGRVQARLAGRPREWDAEPGSGRNSPLNLTVCAASGDVAAAKGTTLDHHRRKQPIYFKTFLSK